MSAAFVGKRNQGGGRPPCVWSDVPDWQLVRRDDAQAALAGGDEDEFGAAADDAHLDGFLPRAGQRDPAGVAWYGYFVAKIRAKGIISAGGYNEEHEQPLFHQ